MIAISRKLQVLGICGSPRKQGNSQYLLEIALQATKEKYQEFISVKQYTVRGKKFSPCTGCFKCSENHSLGECVIQDDFQNLRDLWLDSDVIIYSVPVYHYSIPGQLKCFLDRLGNTLNRRFETTSPRFLKIIGSIVQGSHFAAGQESTVTFLMQHAVMKNCIPVSGDGWPSYIGACGWTLNSKKKNSMEKLAQDGNMAAEMAIQASITLCRRAIELALIVHLGVKDLRQILVQDRVYDPFLERLEQPSSVSIGKNKI
jgi:multimeric flavodoxin WrbA